MESKLVSKLLDTPERENAGARSANRFTYQQVWAFDYILDIMDSGKEFILFMEFHDDIIILDRSAEVESIEFYQIKTDDKDGRYITTSFITTNAKKYPNKMSIAQKMIYNYTKFEKQTKSIHLVSNKHFDFGDLQNKIESKRRRVIKLSEVENDEVQKIKNGMCQACINRGQCEEECLNLIYFDVSDLGLESYEDTVMGRLVKKMDLLGISGTIERTRSIYNTILGEIRRINNTEKVSQNIEELIKRKSISKKKFLEWIDKLKVEMPDNLWNQIFPLLLADGFTPLEIKKINKEWKKYRIESMDVEALGLEKIASEVSKIINDNEDRYDNSKELIECVYNEIKSKVEVKIYNKNYLYALISKELFS